MQNKCHNNEADKSLDLTQIPLSALKKSTLISLSASLNQQKIIPTNDGLPRDWRGLAQLIGLNGVETNRISVMPDRFSALIEHWGTKGNVSIFQEYLGYIDRYDVLDDTRDAIAKDSLEYIERLKKINLTIDNISVEADKRILTVSDVIRLEKGLDPQIYDAFILYAEEDADFATEIVETLENKYNLKLCVRDRDLIGGVPFEHDAITKLIAERCRRLVVVVSSNFLKSKANKFLVTFAQALGIDIRERKVIPILYERCEVPPELRYYFLLDYNRAGKLWNFWDKLRDSIQSPEVSQSKLSSGYRTATSSKVEKNDLWISRTRFGDDQIDSDPKSSIPISRTEMRPASKKTNIYKMLKNGFTKVKKGSTSREAVEKIPEDEAKASLTDHIKTFVSAGKDDSVPFENFDNSSSFEAKDEIPSSVEKSKKVKKKKWYKKRAMEKLLT